MKKILMFLAFSGFAFACDAPHEEVQGVKIGCPLAVSDGYTLDKGTGMLEGKTKVYRKKDIKFFDSLEVEVYENDIPYGVVFVKKYYVSIKNMDVQTKKIMRDFSEFKTSLEERWGEATEVDAPILKISDRLSRYYFTKDTEDVVKIESSKSKTPLTVVLAMRAESSAEKITSKGSTVELVLFYLTDEADKEMDKIRPSKTKGF